jgi:hypothetical protein
VALGVRHPFTKNSAHDQGATLAIRPPEVEGQVHRKPGHRVHISDSSKQRIRRSRSRASAVCEETRGTPQSAGLRRKQGQEPGGGGGLFFLPLTATFFLLR